MKLFFDMQIVDEMGTVHGRIRREITEDAAYIGNRVVDDLRMGVGSFESAVQTMKVRTFRRDLLMQAARQCGASLADHLEDREGWHGADRQESTERRIRDGASPVHGRKE